MEVLEELQDKTMEGVRMDEDTDLKSAGRQRLEGSIPSPSANRGQDSNLDQPLKRRGREEIWTGPHLIYDNMQNLQS